MDKHGCRLAWSTAGSASIQWLHKRQRLGCISSVDVLNASQNRHSDRLSADDVQPVLRKPNIEVAMLSPILILVSHAGGEAGGEMNG